MTPKQILKETAVFLKYHGWTQKAYSRNAEGEVVTNDSENAISFCAMGAMYKILRRPDLTYKEQNILAVQAAEHFNNIIGIPLIAFNDGLAKSKEEVIEALTKASRRSGNRFIDFFAQFFIR